MIARVNNRYLCECGRGFATENEARNHTCSFGNGHTIKPLCEYSVTMLRAFGKACGVKPSGMLRHELIAAIEYVERQKA